MLESLLIANRGEIACRILRTAQRLGIRTVAVYSAADAGARHVQLADQALPIGPAAARESYLHGERIVAAALASGARAVHPGYGFLAENPAFAEACEAAGLIFVGPPASVIRAMGSKSEAKQCMAAAGLPLIPGYHGERQDPGFLAAEAEVLGYPVLIKPCAGGGGRGLRRVDHAREFGAALAAARREAAAAFGDERVLIEKCLIDPRHIEVQILSDRHGHHVHLHERDCSAQRRYQKILEEAPAPGLPAATRAALGAAALAAARAVGYVGAGTVEFALAPDGRFHFIEMNTRLQVEHPVTEMVTGLDLVEWQLRIADGEVLPFGQPALACTGHAIEVRICAEDPERGFLPAGGRLEFFATPPEGSQLRIDSGVAEGDVVGTHYDSMLAKLIVWGEDRPAACRQLCRALADLHLVGPANNLAFLARLAELPAFLAGAYGTGLIEAQREALCAPEPLSPRQVLLAALAELLDERARAQARAAASQEPASPWHAADSWRLNLPARRMLAFRVGVESCEVGVEGLATGWRLSLHEGSVLAHGVLGARGVLRFALDGACGSATWFAHGVRRYLSCAGRALCLERLDGGRPVDSVADREGGLRAPMPGRVLALLAQAGTTVARGTPLLVLEAMKMEHMVRAPGAGTVLAWRCAPGQPVEEGAELLEFRPAADESPAATAATTAPDDAGQEHSRHEQS